MIHIPLTSTLSSPLTHVLCPITPLRKAIGVKFSSKSISHALHFLAHHNHIDFTRSQKPGWWEAFHLWGSISIGIIYSSLPLLVVYILIDGYSHWNTWENLQDKMWRGRCYNVPGSWTYTRSYNWRPEKCSDYVIHAGQASKWTKEGLLEHIIELIVVEEKVCVQISKSLSYLNLMIIPVL